MYIYICIRLRQGIVIEDLGDRQTERPHQTRPDQTALQTGIDPILRETHAVNGLRSALSLRAIVWPAETRPRQSWGILDMSLLIKKIAPVDSSTSRVSVANPNPKLHRTALDSGHL